jgi:hypothetical protein
MEGSRKCPWAEVRTFPQGKNFKSHRKDSGQACNDTIVPARTSASQCVERLHSTLASISGPGRTLSNFEVALAPAILTRVLSADGEIVALAFRVRFAFNIEGRLEDSQRTPSARQ